MAAKGGVAKVHVLSLVLDLYFNLPPLRKVRFVLRWGAKDRSGGVCPPRTPESVACENSF